jgi:SAM-dependent methyltransferase
VVGERAPPVPTHGELCHTAPHRPPDHGELCRTHRAGLPPLPTVTDEVLADQVDYYRRRAAEYDVTAYGDVAAARERIARLVAELRPAGRVLEIACGTGLWTEALAGWADTMTAIDAAPEAVAIARDRVRPASVSFEVADVFSWDPGTRFDVIFFSAWLSHVPASRFGQFWQLLGSLLAGTPAAPAGLGLRDPPEKHHSPF